MKQLINTFLLSFIFISINHSQSIEKTDSTKFDLKIKSLRDFNLLHNDFELYNDLNNPSFNVSLDDDPQTVWLKTHLALSNSKIQSENFSPHLLRPLERKYLEDSKFNLVRYMLGAAQVGAVGYLAYKHIKKYGFLKK
jgi:hypothetical protein